MRREYVISCALLALACGIICVASPAPSPTPAPTPSPAGGGGGGSDGGGIAVALGTSFTYQGLLKQSGAPVNGLVDLQFTLFDGPNAGAVQIGLVNTLNNQTLIPSSAVQHNGSIDFVYLISDNKATMRTVKVGISDKGDTAVQGIQPGDVVANSSFEKLQNGSQISVSKVKLPSTSDAAESDAP